MGYMEFDSNEPTNQRWKEMMEEKLKTASLFEIHCWTEETEEIALDNGFWSEHYETQLNGI